MALENVARQEVADAASTAARAVEDAVFTPTPADNPDVVAEFKSVTRTVEIGRLKAKIAVSAA